MCTLLANRLVGRKTAASQRGGRRVPVWLDRAEIQADDFRFGMIERIVNGPNTRACAEIKHSLCIFDQGFVKVSARNEKHSFMVDVQSLLFNLIASPQ